MKNFSPAIQELLRFLNNLPGVGPKTARRYLFHLLREPPLELQRFAAAIGGIPNELAVCGRCGDYSQKNPCELCSDSRRDKTLLAVVADNQDLGAMESTGEFQGLYHILGGALSPLQGITPERLRVKELLLRAKEDKITEILLAFDPDIDGESTMLYLGKLLYPLGVKVTRLARGLPMGSNLEYADPITLTDAIKGRRAIN